MIAPTLVRRQTLDASHSVSVWRQGGHYNGQPAITYQKVWEGPAQGSAEGWLSWGLHEHLLLTLLAGRGVRSAVTALGLKKDTHRIELSTLDAGPELQQDWLGADGPLLSDTELVKLAYHTLQALVQIHREGVVHGDLKADNICVAPVPDPHTGARCADWRSLKLIDFAFSLSRDNPLRFVLPIDTRRIDYHPAFYKRAVEKSQQSKSPAKAQAACSASIDLYSLGVMLQKLVVRCGGACPGASDLARACLRAGARRRPWRWPWSDARFEAQTLQMEQAALDWLRAQGLGEDAIGRSVPVEAAASAATPMRVQAPSTPLAAVAPTPLLAPAPAASTTAPAPAPAPSPAPVQAPAPVRKAWSDPAALVKPPARPRPPRFPAGPWARMHWIGVTLLLALCFRLVDQAYLATQLRLSDAGYFSALLAMACAAPMAAGALVQALSPRRPGEWVCLVAALTLAGAALFHGISVSRAGLPWFQAALMAVTWLLAVTLGAWHAVGALRAQGTSA